MLPWGWSVPWQVGGWSDPPPLGPGGGVGGTGVLGCWGKIKLTIVFWGVLDKKILFSGGGWERKSSFFRGGFEGGGKKKQLFVGGGWLGVRVGSHPPQEKEKNPPLPAPALNFFNPLAQKKNELFCPPHSPQKRRRILSP